ncbi:hypothetical protein Tco_1175579 [Tanacetum coccineum]
MSKTIEIGKVGTIPNEPVPIPEDLPRDNPLVSVEVLSPTHYPWILPETPRKDSFHNEDGNPARANIKQALGYLKDGDGDGNSQFLRCQVNNPEKPVRSRATRTHLKQVLSNQISITQANATMPAHDLVQLMSKFNHPISKQSSRLMHRG